VTVSPTVEVSPSTQVHVVGDSTTVECRSSGRPQPRRKSTWSATARRSSVVRRVDLNHDASPRGRREHDGRVSCVGSTSTTTQVHVVGDSTTVECRASGRPQPRRKSTWSATVRRSSVVRRVDLNHASAGSSTSTNYTRLT